MTKITVATLKKMDRDLDAFGALLDKHGIERGPNQWFLLALALAREHEFEKESKLQGRHLDPKRTTNDICILAGIGRWHIEKGHSVANTARLIAKRYPGIGTANSVKTRIYILKKRGPELQRAVKVLSHMDSKKL